MVGGVDPDAPRAALEHRIGMQPPRVILNREAVKDLPAAERMNCACGACIDLTVMNCFRHELRQSRMKNNTCK